MRSILVAHGEVGEDIGIDAPAIRLGVGLSGFRNIEAQLVGAEFGDIADRRATNGIAGARRLAKPSVGAPVRQPRVRVRDTGRRPSSTRWKSSSEAARAAIDVRE